MSLNPSSGSNRPPGSEPEAIESVTAGISREMVQLYVRAFGRGPTQARTFVPPQFAVCVLRGILTTSERTLVESGGIEEVESGRTRINDAIDAEYIEIVEGFSGRLVQSHLVHVKVANDLVVHLFLFHDALPTGGAAAGLTG